MSLSRLATIALSSGLTFSSTLDNLIFFEQQLENGVQKKIDKKIELKPGEVEVGGRIYRVIHAEKEICVSTYYPGSCLQQLIDTDLDGIPDVTRCSVGRPFGIPYCNQWKPSSEDIVTFKRAVEENKRLYSIWV